MARVYLSHSTSDAELADRLRRWLVEDGHEVFLDHDLKAGIRAGEMWQARLHERLRWADAVVCVVTSAYVSSTWCTAEVSFAQARGTRLLPVWAEPGVYHPLLRSLQHVDLTGDVVATRAILAETLRKLDAAGGSGWPDDRSPFPGLRPFDLDMKRVFFGREPDVVRVLDVLRAPDRAEYAMLVLVGRSGCGTSSFLRAGLMPAVASGRTCGVSGLSVWGKTRCRPLSGRSRRRRRSSGCRAS